MTAKEVLKMLLKSYRGYYNVNEVDPLEPFAAQAHFHSMDQSYFLMKKAVTSTSETHEYVYFYTAEHITLDDVNRLAQLSWDDGMAQVRPHKEHRNTDVSLVLIGESIDDDAFEAVKKLRNYKSYKWRFQGWSDFRSVALDLSKKSYVYNQKGEPFKKVFKTLIKNL